jgi:type IV secretion system protein VirB2
MPRHHSRYLPLITATLALVASPAFAQDLSPIVTMLESVEAAMTGPIGVAVSTLAVIGTGFMCMIPVARIFDSFFWF